MSDKTQLVLPGRQVTVSRLAKRSFQIAAGVALTAGLVLVVMLGNGLLMGKATSTQIVNLWLAFIQRSDIMVTMVLTAAVTVLLIYWQRDRETRAPGQQAQQRRQG